MGLRITAIDELQLLTCLKHGLWGAKNNRFSKWAVGDLLVFLTDRRVAALAEVVGKPFDSEETVWNNGLFPHRIPIKFLHVIPVEARSLTSEAITPFLKLGGHANTGFVIQTQLLVHGKPADEIVGHIKSKTNSLESVLSNLDNLIDSAELLRRTSAKETTTASTQEESKSPSYWLLAAGRNGEQWNNFQSEGIIAIGFKEQITKSLKEFKTRDEIKQAFDLLNPPRKPTHGPLACWEFANEMRIGDFVFAKEGRDFLLGFGVIKSHYQYEPQTEHFNHTRKVEWSATGRWHLPKGMDLLVTKTLTNITKYSGFPQELLGIMGIKNSSFSEKQKRFWWLYCNPAIWNISDHPVRSKHTYTSHNSSGNKRVIYRHFQTVRPGDLVATYVSSPIRELRSICKITKGLNQDNGTEQIEFEKLIELENPISLSRIEGDDILAKAENLRNSQGSLFHLTSLEFNRILELSGLTMDNLQGESLASPQHSSPPLFIEPSYFQEIADTLKFKKNIVLQGPPGVGKTFIAKELAQTFTQNPNTHVETIQFHQSYSYEDFIQGYRPTAEGGFEIKNGIFLKFCKKAAAEPAKNFVFIIDEINRGNLSKIFGELLMLIEADKRGEKNSIPLTYSDKGERFYIPTNIYLIGTMNTADRSLAMVDYALRRRFAFFGIAPQFTSEAFATYLKASGVEKTLVDQIINRMTELNAEIVEDKRRLGEGFRIGHSFFCNVDESADLSWYRRIVKHEIAPLLREYWFDDEEKATQAINRLLEDSPTQTEKVA